MARLRCGRCKKSFKTPQALAVHQALSRSCGLKRPAEKVESLPEPVPENISGIREEKWDISWSREKKEAAILRGMGFTWGIGRRGSRWVPIPALYGTDYDTAVIAADKRNVISRIQPVLPARRSSYREPGEDKDDDSLATLLLLAMMSR